MSVTPIRPGMAVDPAEQQILDWFAEMVCNYRATHGHAPETATAALWGGERHDYETGFISRDDKMPGRIARATGAGLLLTPKR
jgi:hypothetical protein